MQSGLKVSRPDRGQTKKTYCEYRRFIYDCRLLPRVAEALYTIGLPAVAARPHGLVAQYNVIGLGPGSGVLVDCPR